jgi:hypothetical protein
LSFAAKEVPKGMKQAFSKGAFGPGSDLHGTGRSRRGTGCSRRGTARGAVGAARGAVGAARHGAQSARHGTGRHGRRVQSARHGTADECNLRGTARGAVGAARHGTARGGTADECNRRGTARQTSVICAARHGVQSARRGTARHGVQSARRGTARGAVGAARHGVESARHGCTLSGTADGFVSGRGRRPPGNTNSLPGGGGHAKLSAAPAGPETQKSGPPRPGKGRRCRKTHCADAAHTGTARQPADTAQGRTARPKRSPENQMMPQAYR